METRTTTPRYQIRALYDDNTITVYQAYSSEIASAAVKAQKLSASPSFKLGRMTWIKPSWCWMMYRCGYSYKDRNQERVLAITMKHRNFITLLEHAQLAHKGSSRVTGTEVVIQWDPERGPRLEKLDFRSIQIGITGDLNRQWIEHWIDSIEDVTEKARQMKEMLDEDEAIDRTALEQASQMPLERVYEVPENVMRLLEMTNDT